jgi:hypothetical protein
MFYRGFSKRIPYGGGFVQLFSLLKLLITSTKVASFLKDLVDRWCDPESGNNFGIEGSMEEINVVSIMPQPLQRGSNVLDEKSFTLSLLVRCYKLAPYRVVLGRQRTIRS